MSSLPATLSQDVASLTPTTKELLQSPPHVWGKLLPMIRTIPDVDLKKPTFTLGRNLTCDVKILEHTISVNTFARISKNHFRIDKGTDHIIRITDLSRNGTFVNGRPIGLNKQFILQDGDKIAIALKKLIVYKFICFQNPTLGYLPEGLKEKYEVSHMLGEGACGEVRLIYDKYTCREYACKKIRKSTSGVKPLNRPENIKREIEILKQLNHPFLISVKEIEETQDAFFLIMDYMEGGELTYFIRSPKRLAESQVKYFFYQITLAVKHLHDMNITHRDLKPENILLKNDQRDDNMVKISDFGLSKMTSEQTMMKTQCGTPYFAAPEILDPSVTTYGKKVDIWSMGVILFYMLSQYLPFKAPNTLALAKLILSGKYTMTDPVWDKISFQAKDLIKKMLVRDPKERISIDGVVNHVWFDEDEDLKIRVEDLISNNYETRVFEESDSEECEQDSKRIKLSKDIIESSVD